MMDRERVTYHYRLLPGGDDTIRTLTASAEVFSPDEIAVAAALALESLRVGEEESGYHYILALTDGTCAGYACYGPTACTKKSFDLYWIAVDARFKAAGIGTRLLALAEEKVKASGGGKLYIETSSRLPYLPARRFYQKHGYRQEALIPDFYDDGDHKLIYVKDLI